ncbi:MAG: Omp28-related outer membrane protein [Bacteroidales bacterium]|nr:Omp28-related outer membrane protein [Bacteroidales bacterium]
MKTIITTILILVAGIFAAQSQTLVTTQTLNKNVVLEDYTGIHCQYCPEGHAIAAAILANNPGRAATIAIHQGSFANPSPGEPDYRTPFGDPLAAQTGLTGYPSGTVNRHVFTGTTTALSRGDWTASSEIILQQPSPVNVGIETSFNAATRELTVHVELYYTSNSSVSTNYINVALIQNHVFGPQTGGGAGNNYEHMDMLRYLITGQWGDPVTTTTMGSLVDRTYNYTIPADYISVPCMVENCEVVVFVSEGHQEILSGDVVPAIDGTNLYVGDISAGDSVMKLGQPSMVTDFDLMANSNLTGTEPFKIKLVSAPPADWSSVFEIDGSTFTDSAMVNLVKGTPKPIILHVTPGNTAGFEDFTFELSSINNPNAPIKYFTARVISNVHTLLVNAAGDNYATQYQNVYIAGLEAAGCDRLAVMKSNVFVQAKNAGILTGILNIFYNCAWTFPAFTDPEANAVKLLVDAGKHLFVAGQDIGWDIMSAAAGSHGTIATKDLYTNYLKAAYLDDGNTTNNKLIANAADPIYGTVATSSIIDVYGGNMYPDQINPVQNATAIFYYNTALTKIGAVKSTKDESKVVYFGVGFEMLQNVTVRDDILGKTYNWFMEGVGINEKTLSHRAHLGQNFPNPANSETVIPLYAIDQDMALEISDITGRTLSSQPVQAGDEMIRISTASLSNGLYLYKLVDGGKIIDTRKLNIQR